jgi:lysophospholipase L1-like esterase
MGVVIRSFVLVLGVAFFAACRSAGDAAEAVPVREPRTFGSRGAALNYVVLGDSTAAGVGADYEQGIAVRTAEALGGSRRVTMHNFGVSGARAAGVVRDQLPLALERKPDLVLLSVSANDVTHLTSAKSVRSSIEQTVQALRRVNPKVAIVITGSPDMGSPPRIPWLLRALAARRTASINRELLELAASERLVFAPIAEETGPLFRADHSLFAGDRFHPNERGYATWVSVLNRALALAIG